MKKLILSASFMQLMLVIVILMVSACAGNKPYTIDLMPSPDVYDDGAIDPFTDTGAVYVKPYDRILYATDRLPADEGDKSLFYGNARGGVLRLGAARVELAKAKITWEEARRISLAKNRSEKYPIRVSGVEEYGILDRSAASLAIPEQLGENSHAAARAFADAVNAKLANSRRKDIYVYTHGYKVIFENPVLVANELWHFLGYDGAFIAYAWPSTPSRWAYLRDIETAVGFARNLRIFLEYLAEETNAENIHVLGYSAGTQLVARTLEQLALMNHEREVEQIHTDLKIGHVILVGSDLDREIFSAYLADGLLRVPQHVSIYISEKDKALSLSRFLTRRERLGQMWSQDMNPAVADYLYQNEAEISIINVTEASQATAGNGHGYFRRSPWASSDILITLAYGLSPAERGLVRGENLPIWAFPADYIERLRAAIIKANPDLRPALEKN
jgi:esterase/lipase superfamily enzyme